MSASKTSSVKVKKDEPVNADLNCASIGNYVFIKTLGEGNFAKVKLAKHKLTNAEVAIKVIDKTTLDEKKLGKLYREVRIMKMLHHPNIVKLYEVIETKNTMFLVMELSSGGELYDYLVVHGKMKEKEARAKFRQILSAVSYCHKKRVIHRDLKAENLLLDANLDIKIADFGFSNMFDPDSKLDTFCGSPPYAAPELFQGRRYTGPEVDIWSLGVILYVLTTGCLPFDGKNLQDMRESVCKGKYRIPFYLSDGCEKLLRKMLVRDPIKRASLDIFIDDAWLNEGYDHSPIVKDVSQKIEEDENIIRLIEAKYHLEKSVIVQSLKDNIYDDISAIYYLLYYEKETRGRIEADTLMSPVVGSGGLPGVGNGLPGSGEHGKGKIEDPTEGAISGRQSAVNKTTANRRRYTVGTDADMQKYAEEDEEASRMLSKLQKEKDTKESEKSEKGEKGEKSEKKDFREDDQAEKAVHSTGDSIAKGTSHKVATPTDDAIVQVRSSVMATPSARRPSVHGPKDQAPIVAATPLSSKTEGKSAINNDAGGHGGQSVVSVKEGESSTRKRHNTIVGILRNTLYRPTDPATGPASPTMGVMSPSSDKGGDTVGTSAVNTQASQMSVSDADAFEPVKPGDEGKPRSLRFTFSSNTTSSKPADDIVREVLHACAKKGLAHKLVSRYLVECHSFGGKENPEEGVKFEIEVCRLPRLKNLHGFRFKRIGGSSNDYKDICEQLVAMLKL